MSNSHADLHVRLSALESRIAHLEAKLRDARSDSGAKQASELGGPPPVAPADLESRAMNRERGVIDLLESFRHPPFYRALLDAVSARIGRDLYLAWFVGTRLEADDGGEITISTNDALQGDWLGQTYRPIVEDALGQVGRPGTTVRFVVRPHAPALSAP